VPADDVRRDPRRVGVGVDAARCVALALRRLDVAQIEWRLCTMNIFEFSGNVWLARSPQDFLGRWTGSAAASW
jgi:hypothetical protein